jgi:hypothetical protein
VLFVSTLGVGLGRLVRVLAGVRVGAGVVSGGVLRGRKNAAASIASRIKSTIGMARRVIFRIGFLLCLDFSDQTMNNLSSFLTFIDKIRPDSPYLVMFYTNG